MKCHAGVEYPSGAPCPKCGAKFGEVCWPGINADLAEVASLRSRLARAQAAVDFCEWLNGYFGGINRRDELTALEANSIRAKLYGEVYPPPEVSLTSGQ
jgi:hypothetical protein